VEWLLETSIVCASGLKKQKTTKYVPTPLRFKRRVNIHKDDSHSNYKLMHYRSIYIRTWVTKRCLRRKGRQWEGRDVIVIIVAVAVVTTAIVVVTTVVVVVVAVVVVNTAIVV